MNYLYKLSLLFLLFSTIVSANEINKKHEKKKVIKKEFAVNSNAEVALDNRYGNLNITTWDENKVVIEVTITVKGNDLDDVENKLSSIDVTFNATNSLVTAKTNFEKTKQSWSWWGNNKNINYKVNYVVKIPITNSVDLDNDYGSIYLDKLKGRADINCDYGDIEIGELSANNNIINLDYCSSSSIEYIESGNINLDYSKLIVDNSNKINTSTDYSTIKFNQVVHIDFSADYGSITINEADNINGNSDYAAVRIGTIKKNLVVETDYGSVSIKNLATGFENINIDTEYAAVRIGVNPDAVFNFELDLQYASFSRDDANIEFYKSISKTTKKYYEGKFGKGNTNSKLTIRSQYGGVSIKEN